MMPTFVIVGTAKAGTRSLVEALGEHPDVAMATRKESHYFARAAIQTSYTGPGDLALAAPDKPGAGLVFGRSQYESLFSCPNGEGAIGEASVFYMYYHRAVVPTIQAELGEPKIIIVLRNPVARAYSAYKHLRGEGRETLGFYEALMQEDKRRNLGYAPLWLYRAVGMYTESVEHFLDSFRDVRVFWYDDLTQDPRGFVRDLYRFLEVDDAYGPRSLGIRYNSTSTPVHPAIYQFVVKPNRLKDTLKPALNVLLSERSQRLLHERLRQVVMKAGSPPDTRAVRVLKDAFHDDVMRLGRLTGRNLSSWL